MSPKNVIIHPLMTEKCMMATERENKLAFIVSKKANKNQIREAIEKEFNVKVANINTQTTTKGRKKAIVQLEKEHSAEDIVANMGVI